MQLLFEGSEESPGAAGLGVLPGTVRLLPGDVKRPQMQWNLLERRGDPELLAGLRTRRGPTSCTPTRPTPTTRIVIATCDYGGPVVAAVERGNVWATQFHPEKSSRTGLAVLSGVRATAAPPRSPPDGPLPGHRPARRAGRPAHPGRLRPRARPRRRPGRGGQGLRRRRRPWIHIVDLDAARTGEPVNRDLIAAIAAAVDVPVQAGGGVRSAEAAAALADAGVARVVMGTAALEDPDLVATDRVPPAGGAGPRRAGPRGRRPGLGGGVGRRVARGAAAPGRCRRRGRRRHPDRRRGPHGRAPTSSGLAEVLAATSLDVIASGGVGTLDDLLALDAVAAGDRRLAGAIVGTAIYEGRVDVAEAVAGARA